MESYSRPRSNRSPNPNRTRSNLSQNLNRTRSNHIAKVAHEHTYDGLHKWYVGMFEKLGWMLLANKNGWDDKIITYKNSVHRLEEAIFFKHNNTTDPDRKMDLKIMLENVHVLKEHIDHDFQ